MSAHRARRQRTRDRWSCIARNRHELAVTPNVNLDAWFGTRLIQDASCRFAVALVFIQEYGREPPIVELLPEVGPAVVIRIRFRPLQHVGAVIFATIDDTVALSGKIDAQIVSSWIGPAVFNAV